MKCFLAVKRNGNAFPSLFSSSSSSRKNIFSFISSKNNNNKVEEKEKSEEKEKEKEKEVLVNANKNANKFENEEGFRVGKDGEEHSHLCKKFAARIGVEFNNINLLENAVTSKSFGLQFGNNERLKFVGSGILHSVIRQHLFTSFPNLPAGGLNRGLILFSNPNTLALIGKELGLYDIARYNINSLENTIAQLSLVADAFEGVVGAIYQDKGLIAANQFIQRYVLSREVDVTAYIPLEDAKVKLRALLLSKKKGRPQFKLINETGRHTHRPEFSAAVTVDDVVIGTGTAISITEAEKKAALNALVNHYGYVQSKLSLADYVLPMKQRIKKEFQN